MALGYSFISKPIIIAGTDVGAGTIKYTDMATLADGYSTGVIGTLVTGGGPSKMNLYICYSMGVGETTNSLDFIVEGSPTGNDYARYVNDATSGATSTLTRREFTMVGTNAGTIYFSLPLDIQDKYIRLQFKETGAVTNFGRVHCRAVLFGDK